MSISSYLVSINVDNLLKIQRKEDIQKKNLIAPDDPLLLRLLTKPMRPLIRYELILKPKGVGESLNGDLQRGQRLRRSIP